MNMEKYYNPFRKKTVKEGDEYVEGIYINRVPAYGIYIEGEESFIKELEIKSKGKFKLENDPENYAQEVRMHYYISLEKYIEKFGIPATEEEEFDMVKYVSKSCLNKLRDLARGMKSKVSYYDKEKEEIIIQTMISIESCKEKEVLLDSLEYMIFCQNDSREGSYNEFSSWFNRNKVNLLTRKQLEYLNDSSVVDRSNQKKIEKNIVKRIDKKYSDLTIKSCKIMELERKIDLLDNILNSDDEREMLKKIVAVMDCEDWIVEILYSADFETCKVLTDATKGIFYKSKRIYDISIILIKKLEKLEEIVKLYNEK